MTPLELITHCTVQYSPKESIVGLFKLDTLLSSKGQIYGTLSAAIVAPCKIKRATCQQLLDFGHFFLVGLPTSQRHCGHVGHSVDFGRANLACRGAASHQNQEM